MVEPIYVGCHMCHAQPGQAHIRKKRDSEIETTLAHIRKKRDSGRRKG